MDKQYLEALKVLVSAGKLEGDYILYTTIVDIYRGPKQYTQAEAMLNKQRVQNLISFTAIYLAKLYMQWGFRSRAIEKAREVLNMDPKGENNALVVI
jgi:tetratricopeptide (TPR) repeat protein